MDGMMRALMALDEIPRAIIDWRELGNRPLAYVARSSIKPLPRH